MDMAICMVLFNPTQSKRIVMNALYVKNLFELQGFPTYFLELVYEGRSPEIKDAFHVKASSYMFHKENLFRVLETKIPTHFTKLAFLDADLMFPSPSWYRLASDCLETHDVVQPFEFCHWLDLSYKKTLQTRKTACLQKGTQWDFDYHPGFAWCMRRDWYTQIGFYDYAVSGSGDLLSAAAWLRMPLPETLQSKPRLLLSHYHSYSDHPMPRISFLKNLHIIHLFHGSNRERQYDIRHSLLDKEGMIEDFVFKNEDGVLEWKDKEIWNPFFLEYFEARKDDNISDAVPHVVPQWALRLQKKLS
jgi:hypothetical protein